MTSNISTLTQLFAQNQYGHIKVTSHSTQTVIRDCDGINDYCDHDEPHTYLDHIPVTRVLADGLLRNYTVRECDLLITVLRRDDQTATFVEKVQLKFDRRANFVLRGGFGSSSVLERRARWGFDFDLRIELSLWGTVNR